MRHGRGKRESGRGWWQGFWLAAAALTPHVQADDPAPDAATAPPPAKNSDVQLQGITVTARKRQEKLQDVPGSVLAFTGAHLDALGIDDLRDLGTYVPGLQFTDLAGYNLIYLRGVGTDAFIPSADPSVATYLDGVYLPSAHNLAQSFGDVERVEVLKGPQGTLFGRNSTGGALSIVTRNPGDEAEFSILENYSPRFDDTRTRVSGSLPITHRLGASLSGFYNHATNDYRRDPATAGDRHIPSEVNEGARGKIVLRPFDSLTLTLSGLLVRQTGTSTTTSANTHPSALLGATIPAEKRDYVITADAGPSLTTQTRAYYAVLDWKKPWFDTRLLGSNYYVNAYRYVYDFDASSQGIATYGADSDFQRITTGELQLSSNDTTWGSRWLKWIGGFYYLNSRGGYNPGYLTLTNIGLPTTGAPVQTLFDLLPQPLHDAVNGLPALDSATFYFTGLIGAESYSGYAQATASPFSWLNLTAGGRYQRETRTLIRSDVGLRNLGGGLTTIISFDPRDSTVNNFSPKITLDVKPTKRLLLYASYAQGFKSATYNIINIYQQPDYVLPEKVTSYEAGIKSDWFGGHLRINAAAFRNEIDNLQTGFVSFTSGGAINFENAGHARIRGVEVDSLLAPLPHWLPGFAITGSTSWLNAVYTDYQNGSGYDETTGLAFSKKNGDGRDFTGNSIVRTPAFSSTLGLSQTLRTSIGQFELAGDWYHNSGYYYLAQNSPVSYEPRYSVFNAHLGWRNSYWHTRVAVFGRNLADKRYDLAQFHTDFGREDTLAPPRTIGVRVELDL